MPIIKVLFNDRWGVSAWYQSIGLIFLYISAGFLLFKQKKRFCEALQLYVGGVIESRGVQHSVRKKVCSSVSWSTLE
jgi:hypothetical protein